MPSDNNGHATTFDAHLRRLKETLHTLAEADKQDTLTGAGYQAALQQLQDYAARDFPPETSSLITEASVAELLDGFIARRQVRTIAAGTGFNTLDNVLGGGIQPQRLIGLLGAPGFGKTSLANQIADTVASTRPVLYLTTEDVPDVLLAKTLARRGGVDYGAVLRVPQAQQARIQQVMREHLERPSARNLRYLDATSGTISMNALRDRAKAHFDGKPGPGLLVVDYLQRMARSMRTSRELREAVTELTEQLRAIACELNCCVLAVASMNRASGYGKGDTSTLSAAKESGDIEYTCDVMMALVEDKGDAPHSYQALRALRVDKNRQGATTTVHLLWNAMLQKFNAVGEEE